MKYCKRCVYPENAKPGIIIHEDGICSGCKHVESRNYIEWPERENLLVEILEEHRKKQEEKKTLITVLFLFLEERIVHFKLG